MIENQANKSVCLVVLENQKMNKDVKNQNEPFTENK